MRLGRFITLAIGDEQGVERASVTLSVLIEKYVETGVRMSRLLRFE